MLLPAHGALLGGAWQRGGQSDRCLRDKELISAGAFGQSLDDVTVLITRGKIHFCIDAAWIQAQMLFD